MEADQQQQRVPQEQFEAHRVAAVGGDFLAVLVALVIGLSAGLAAATGGRALDAQRDQRHDELAFRHGGLHDQVGRLHVGGAGVEPQNHLEMIAGLQQGGQAGHVALAVVVVPPGSDGAVGA